MFARKLVGVIVLLAARAADWTTIKQGIVGDSHMKPYNIVIIFMSQVGAMLFARHKTLQNPKY